MLSLLTLVAGTVSPLPARPAASPTERPTRETVSASLAANQIDPWQLISYVEKGTSRPPATLFNLACFYTRARDFTIASKLLLGAVRETQRQERQSLVNVAMSDPGLKPLLDKRPGIEAKLYEMLDTDPPFADADELRHHFDRQDRTICHFQSHGWNVTWEVRRRVVPQAASGRRVCAGVDGGSPWRRLPAGGRTRRRERAGPGGPEGHGSGFESLTEHALAVAYA